MGKFSGTFGWKNYRAKVFLAPASNNVCNQLAEWLYLGHGPDYFDIFWIIHAGFSAIRRCGVNCKSFVFSRCQQHFWWRFEGFGRF